MSCNSWWKWTHSQLSMLILYTCLTFLLTFHLLSVMQIKRTWTMNCFATFWSCNCRCQTVVTGLSLSYSSTLQGETLFLRLLTQKWKVEAMMIHCSMWMRVSTGFRNSLTLHLEVIWVLPTKYGWNPYWYCPSSDWLLVAFWCLLAHPPLWEVAACFNIHQPYTLSWHGLA
jgi:hypothetical protein